MNEAGLIQLGENGLEVAGLRRKRRGIWPLADGGRYRVEPGKVVGFTLSDKGATVTRVIGKKTDPNITRLISLYEQGITTQFNRAARLQASRVEKFEFTQAGNEKLRDLRDVPLIAVDGNGTRLREDAVWAERTAEGGLHFIIAITDTARYVPPDSAVDVAARALGNATYLRGYYNTMLPQRLLRKTSFVAGSDRPAYIVEGWLDQEGKLADYVNPHRAVVRVDRCISYSDLQAIRERRAPAHIQNLTELADVLYEVDAVYRNKQHIALGDLDLDPAKPPPSRRDAEKIHTGADNLDLSPGVENGAYATIQTFMLLSSTVTGMALHKADAPCIWRVQTRSNQPAVELELLGVSTARPGQPTLRELQDYKAGLKHSKLMPPSLGRMFAGAGYSLERKGHASTGNFNHNHSTAPSRRYSDLKIQHLVKKVFEEGGRISSEERAALDTLTVHLTDTGQRSARAQQADRDRKVTEAIAPLLNRSLDGTITGFAQDGMFIRIAELSITGFLPARNGPRLDRYQVEPPTDQMPGKTRAYKLNDVVEIKVVEADPLSGRITFGFTDKPPKNQVVAPQLVPSVPPFEARIS